MSTTLEKQKGYVPPVAGFTLIEALIYIALFVIIIGGGLLGAYQIIEGTRQVENKTIIEAEANFLLRKLDWALSGSTVVTPAPGASGDLLRVNKDGDTFEFTLDGSGVMTIDDVPLSSARVLISNLEFTRVPENLGTGRPEALEITFEVNGQAFGPTTRYLRTD